MTGTKTNDDGHERLPAARPVRHGVVPMPRCARRLRTCGWPQARATGIDAAQVTAGTLPSAAQAPMHETGRYPGLRVPVASTMKSQPPEASRAFPGPWSRCPRARCAHERVTPVAAYATRSSLTVAGAAPDWQRTRRVMETTRLARCAPASRSTPGHPLGGTRHLVQAAPMLAQPPSPATPALRERLALGRAIRADILTLYHPGSRFHPRAGRPRQ